MGFTPLPSGVIIRVHSLTTSVAIAVTPIIEVITVSKSENIIKRAAGLPKVSFILYISVCPDTIVILLMLTITIYVKKHDNASAHVIDIPNFAPDDAIVVTLPVPMIYPIMNIPGPIDDAKRSNLDLRVFSAFF